MLQCEHSAILSTFIKLSFANKTFVLSIFEWPLKTGFTIYLLNRNFNAILQLYWQLDAKVVVSSISIIVGLVCSNVNLK